MTDNRIKDALDGIARRDVPETINLWPRIMSELNRRNSFIQSYRPYRTRPFAVVMIVILILLFLTGVAYAIGHMFGFVPGIGIISNEIPLRVLVEPVTQTRDGVTLTIKQAILSNDKTFLIYSVEGIPTDAIPTGENVVGCNKLPEIRLPDGTLLEFLSGGGGWGTGYESKAIFAAIPANIDEATFVMPCISGILAGTLPENWELQIHFTNTPPALTVMPVIEVSPPAVSDSLNSTSRAVSLQKIIETQEGYIVIGKIHVTELPANMMILDSIARLKIMDSTGQEVITMIPEDIESVSNERDESAWAIEIKGKQHAWPLTIKIDAVNAGFENGDYARFKFDTGPNPQIDQDWILNQDVTLNGYHITLLSVHRLVDGYQFNIKADPQVTGLSIQIDGFSAVGSGGGSDGKGNFNKSSIYTTPVPSGKLTLIISIQSILVQGPWSIQWQPDVLPTIQSAHTFSPSNIVCLASDTLTKLDPLPANSNGKVLLYESSNGVDWGIHLANLDGNETQLVASKANWATLSSDGTVVAYAGTDDKVHVTDIAIGDDRILEGAAGYNLRISPDDKFIATIDNRGLNIIALDGSTSRYIPINATTFSLAGWSTDATKIYITIPGAHGFIFESVDTSSGVVENLFPLEDSSHKDPHATVSPDGNWIAYRGQQNNDLYLVRIDGAGGHLIMDRAAVAISSIVWSSDSKWLGVSLVNFNSDKRLVVVLQPESCKAFSLPNIHGDIQGLILP